ncbi:nitroreductase family protein [Lysinibacter sp. HNR]|uniref:nitroreductase family protein n=1 Tax=Lysinibacter sp. HNR TaxID=3031408 RepID=UPI002434E4B9|nr:nitroreductase family protein [Lysinibacter sp. HNR]WGD36586.1 nitroreductase family protein [Lysinibacter sp. HNR]
MNADATATRNAQTSAPILGVLAERWSPRSFDPSATIDESALTSVLEAARWSPSAYNSQPWRYIVARRGSETFNTILSNLSGWNQSWAGNASVLIVTIATTSDAEGTELQWATYDLGQASAHFSVQAHHEGLHVHQMGGIMADELRSAFNLPSNQTPVTVLALGTLSTPDNLANDVLRERETAPRERLPLSEILIVND